MDGTRFVLEISDSDNQALGEGWVYEVRRQAGRDGLDIATAPAQMKNQVGVLIRDAEGRQVWDNTLPARLERLWPALRRQLAVATGLVSGAEPQKESQ
jgi:vacuolar-type H+-ATPase subunit E/Vma4